MAGSIKTAFAVAVVALLLGDLATSVSHADVVHLKNGRSLEGVLLEETSAGILLKLPFGEIGLPLSSVSRIDRGESTLEEFLQKRQELEWRAVGATEWLELATWAQRQGLDHNAREAVLVASRLDPGLPGLAPHMTAMGYEYEQNLAVWLPHEELMRRRGFIERDGRWLSPDQAAAFERVRAQRESELLDLQRQDRVTRTLEMMILAQSAQAEESRRLREEVPVPAYGMPLWGGYPAAVPPGFWPRPPLRPVPHHRGRDRRSHRSHREGIIRRPPGSLILVTPARGESHRGGFRKASESN